MYHPHADEMQQMAMGMMGFWVTHPKDIRQHAVERDYVLLLGAYDIEPGSYTPRTNTMLDFNLWTFNSRVFPGIDPMVARLGDRVRIRVGNLTMTNHPIHLHGHRFEVAGTDGGWVRPEARWPEVSVDIAVGQMRAIEFVADNPGDWAFHCHKSHHTMNAMGHRRAEPDRRRPPRRGREDQRPDPGLHGHGRQGRRDGRHEDAAAGKHAADDGWRGPFGNLDMGGMFTVLKVREGLARGDYRDPGWYKHPAGTVAREWTGEVPAAPQAPGSGAASAGEPVTVASQRRTSTDP